MDYYIQTFLSLCIFLSVFGAAFWLMHIFVSVVIIVLPYAFAVVLGSLIIVAFIAWRRSRGH